MDKIGDVRSVPQALRAGISSLAEEMRHLGFVTAGNAEEAVSLILSAQAAEEGADEALGRAALYAEYQAALDAKKKLLGPLTEATSDLRSRLMAHLLSGGEAKGAHLREKKPTLDIDPEALPAKYTKRVPDMDRIQRMAEAMGEDLQIPGVKVVREWSLVVKGGSE